MVTPRRPIRRHKVPVAYFITFRTYGTWLHGDVRGSMDRFEREFASPTIDPCERWNTYERTRSKRPPVILDLPRREAVRWAIEDTVRHRSWTLLALNVRTNHVHTVIGADTQAERVLNALKANATRVMRQRGLWEFRETPWVDGGSTRYLWDAHAIRMAVDYVLNRQGPSLR